MKLTSIVELAKNCRFEIGRNGESVIAKHSNGSWVEITNKLERLREAIIKDYVNSLEPYAYEIDDGDLRCVVFAEDVVMPTNEAIKISKPLFNLSEGKQNDSR